MRQGSHPDEGEPRLRGLSSDKLWVLRPTSQAPAWSLPVGCSRGHAEGAPAGAGPRLTQGCSPQDPERPGYWRGGRARQGGGS